MGSFRQAIIFHRRWEIQERSVEKQPSRRDEDICAGAAEDNRNSHSGQCFKKKSHSVYRRVIRGSVSSPIRLKRKKVCLWASVLSSKGEKTRDRRG